MFQSKVDATPRSRPVQRGRGNVFACTVFVVLSVTLRAQSVPSLPVLPRAQSLLRENRPQEAIDLLLSRGQAVDPLQLRLALASAYTLLPDTANARKEFDAAVQLAPNRSETHRQYGQALMVLADLSSARSELQRAAVLNPSDGESLYDLALLEARDGQPAAAAALVERAIALTHDHRILRRYYTTGGQMYLLDKNWTAARKSFDLALVLEKDNPAAVAGLGSALEGLNLPKDAVVVLAKAVALDPRNGTAWEQLARAETDLGDCTAAANAYRRASELHPDDRSLLNHLVRAERSCGQADEAATFSQQLKTIVEGEAVVGTKGPELQRINTEAIDSETRGDYQSAEKDYRTLVEIDPKNPIFLRNLGLVLCRQSKWSEGLAELKQALALDPDDLASQQALVAAQSANNNSNQGK